MAFDQSTRNRLARFVSDTRSLLTEEFDRQLQNDYGLDPNSGDVTDLARLDHLDDALRETARLLRDTMEHYLASADTGTPAKAKKARQDVLDRIVREQAFTILNRLCALRMAEARGLLIESIAKGYQSKGFQLYQRLAGTALGETGACYRQFIFSLFDEFAVDLPVLFDRFSPQGRLFPREAALLNMLQEINHPDIDPLWAEDETIGWLYQYYNSIEERKKMREESSAPRNSRELAVRNQFFTPRYVVEFLTDNTLGRIWYEMIKGQTRLTEDCRYLIRRPTEIFLKPGESAPEIANAGKNLLQEELLRQPFYIPHRPLKDPREIRLLDPACGSMHFGLYAFDLFTVIYDEAWEIAHGTDDAAKSADTFVPFITIAATFTDKAAFLREVPRLIVEHNIHGIDIDPRAAQIAGLSLWLRAQRAWHQAGVKPADRLRITRSNLVCAEPMPGEKELLREFVDQQFLAYERPAFAFLLEKIFDRMSLAGEAGSLLRIEDEIRAAIAEARALAHSQSVPRQTELFFREAQPEQLKFDLKVVNDEKFWQAAEQRIYEALEAYAEQAENGGGFQRRLFADDAAQGFAFIDLCRKRYDVVVMNPPFGAFSKASKSYTAKQFPNSANDIFAAFVECCLSRLSETGVLGAITSRTGFFIASFADWRREVVQKTTRLNCFADLGGGVMDNATVEAAAYVFDRSERPGPRGETTPFIRLLVPLDKEPVLVEAIQKLKRGELHPQRVFWASNSHFELLPDSPFVYWADPNTLRILAKWPPFEPTAAQVRKGLRTGNNFRFVRVLWEIPIPDFTPSIAADDSPSKRENSKWVPLVLSGSSQPWFSPLLVALNWRGNGKELRQYVTKYGSPSRLIQAEDFYFRPGMSWTLRAARFVPYAIPSGCIPTGSRPMAFPSKGQENQVLALSASRVASAFMRFYGDWFSRPKFLEGKVKLIPWPDISAILSSQLNEMVYREYERRRRCYQGHEPFFDFIKPFSLDGDGDNAAISIEWPTLLGLDLEASVEQAFGLTRSAADELGRELDEALSVRGASSDSDYAEENDEGAELLLDCSERSRVDALLSHALGCAFGRWDIRYATGEREALELSDPFAPLTVCPPGMLQGADGLPISPEAGRRLRTEDRYPLDVAWDGILVDDPEHPLDLERRFHAAFAVLWSYRTDALEHEACALLGVSTLREWFRRPTGFFADHLKRYSKSRRQAPVYWPLSTPSGSYTLWLYYHRLTDQTIYTCVNDFVDPKLKQLSDDAASLRGKSNRSSDEEKELERLSDLGLELKDFRDELLRIARFWKPNLNDGVQITAAPLWNLFQHRQWKARLKDTWEKLEAGEYDWAHLALSIWPDRVVRASHKDRSYAIAHDLEDLLWHEVEVEKVGRGGRVKKTTVWQPRDLTEIELTVIVSEVKARS